MKHQIIIFNLNKITVIQAAIKACEELKERMRPVKEKMPKATWRTLVQVCFNTNVDLTARH